MLGFDICEAITGKDDDVNTNEDMGVHISTAA
mgnify:CR=1 FL=1